MHSAAVRELNGYLAAALARGALAHYCGPVVVLERRGEELRRRVAVGVHQHGHGHVEADVVRLRDLLGARGVHVHEYVARGQEVVEERDHLAVQPAGIGTHVEDEAQRAVREQLLHGGDRRLAGARVKAQDAHIAYAALQHLIRNGIGVCHAAVDVHGGLVAVGVDYLDGHALAQVGAYIAARVAYRHAGEVLAVDGEDDLALLEPGLVRRGVRRDALDDEAAGGRVLVEADAEAGVLAGGVELVRLVLRGAHVVAPLVPEAVHHGGEGRGGDALLVDVVHEVGVEDVLYFEIFHGLGVVVAAADAVALAADGQAVGRGHADGTHEYKRPEAYLYAEKCAQEPAKSVFHGFPPIRRAFARICRYTGGLVRAARGWLLCCRAARSGVRREGVVGEVGQRIDRGAVDPNLKVQVRSGGPAGGADIADDVALGDALACGDGKAAHMGIERVVAVGVVDGDVVAVGRAVSRDGDGAAVGGQDLGARGAGDVYARVRALVAEERVVTHAEGAGDVGARGAGPDVGARGGGAGAGVLLVVLGGLLPCGLLLGLHLRDYGVDGGLGGGLGGRGLGVFGLGGVYVVLELVYDLDGGGYLLFELGLLGLERLLLLAQLRKRGLVLGLDLLGVLARGLVLLKEALVRVHYLAYHVDGGEHVREAAALEQDVEICIAALFLHGAHALAVELVLRLLGGLGLLKLLGLVLYEARVDVYLLVYELDLLAGQLVLLVHRGLLVDDVGLLGDEVVNVGLYARLLALELGLLLLQGVYLVLPALGQRAEGADNGHHQRHHHEEGQDYADDGYRFFLHENLLCAQTFR